MGAFGNVRVAKSTIPITALQASADTDEKLTIVWTDQTGKTSTLRLDAQRKPPP
jgi:hypothetical protein